MEDYKIHFEKEEGVYWIGRLVKYPSGQVAFIQQVGEYTPYKGVVTRWYNDIKKQLQETA